MTSEVRNPFDFFSDKNGVPLEGGYIYVGTPNFNPEVYPIQLYWDSSLTTPAAQPIRTISGYPSYQGTIAKIYSAASIYSITVRDSAKDLVFSAPQISSSLSTSGASTGASLISDGTQVVNLISDLRTRVKTQPSKFCFVNGYRQISDGGGGMYRLDLSDTTSLDNGGSIIVANDGGRWKLVDTKNIRPEQFGSYGDWNGSIGTDDSAVFVNIASHMAANPGCILTIRNRHYVKSGWVLPASYISIIGIGNAEIHSDGATGQHTVYISGQSNILVHGVKFSQPRSLLRGNEFAICMQNVQYAVVRNCKTDGATAGIWFTHCQFVNVYGCFVDTPKADGIHFSHGSSYCQAVANIVNNAGDDSFSTTYYDASTGRPFQIGFYNNIIQGGVWGFGIAIYSADYVEIIGNRGSELALGLVSVAPNIATSGTDCTNVHISGNSAAGTNRVNAIPNMYWYGTPDTSIDSDPGKLCGALLGGNDVTFVSNTITDAYSSAAGAVNRGLVRFNGGTRIKVMNNSLSKCGGTGIAGGTALLMECSVTGNVIDEALGVGIRFQATPLAVSLGICNNTVGYGATGGDPYMVYMTGAGSVKVAICNNTSVNGRGLFTDAGTGSTNTVIANNNS